jgi:SAM-dependent methyltransferase
VVGGCEELDFAEGEFDHVVCRRALHHMDVARVVPGIHRCLTPGGMFLAEEPVSLHPLVRWVHDRFPFYGSAPHSADERELTGDDLALIRRTFRETRFFHFDLLARESMIHRLGALRLYRAVRLLGKWDYYLANRLLPPLRSLCNYVVIRGLK